MSRTTSRRSTFSLGSQCWSLLATREESELALVRGAVRVDSLALNLKENIMNFGRILLTVLFLMLIGAIPAFQRLLAGLLAKAPVGKVLHRMLRDEEAAAPDRSATDLTA